jgi:hypothetical protein
MGHGAIVLSRTPTKSGDGGYSPSPEAADEEILNQRNWRRGLRISCISDNY